MDNLRSILLLTFATGCFAVQDMFIKFLAAEVGTGQIIFLLGLSGAAFFALMAKLNGQKIFPRDRTVRPLYLRTFCEGFAALFLVVGLAHVPLAMFTAITQAMPLVMTLGAALFLGETIGWRRWLAIGIGFFGVLVIIRPGQGSFDPVVLLPLGAVVVMSMRDLASRRLPHSLASSVVAFQGFGALVISGPVLTWVAGQPLVWISPLGWLWVAAMVGLGIIGYYALIMATRVGDVAAVAPFRYTRLVFSLLIAIVIFGERPDVTTFVGAAMIIATGLYSYLRERRLLRRLAPLTSQ